MDFNVIEGSQVNLITKKPSKSLTFLTISLPCFNEYRNIFYLDNIKIVPKNIEDLLTRDRGRPLALGARVAPAGLL